MRRRNSCRRVQSGGRCSHDSVSSAHTGHDFSSTTVLPVPKPASTHWRTTSTQCQLFGTMQCTLTMLDAANLQKDGLLQLSASRW